MATNHGDGGHLQIDMGSERYKFDFSNPTQVGGSVISDSNKLKNNQDGLTVTPSFNFVSSKSKGQQMTTTPGRCAALMLIMGKLYFDLIKVVFFCGVINSFLAWIYCHEYQESFSQAINDLLAQKTIVALVLIAELVIIALVLLQRGHSLMSSEIYKQLAGSTETRPRQGQKLLPIRSTMLQKGRRCPPDIWNRRLRLK